MGEMVEYPSNGGVGEGYLAPAAGGVGPGIVVIQEWWGLVPHIKDVCDRYAAAGFTAIAPDLYHGLEVTEPDMAGKEMMSLDIERAAKDMAGAIDYLLDHPAVESSEVGVTGFCMGGGLALWLATLRPDAVVAVAPYYGLIPWPKAQPDYSKIKAKVQGHYAENDSFAGPDMVRALEAQLRDLGVDAEMFIYPGAEHAFFNDTRPEVYDAASSKVAWERTTEFFRGQLKG